LKRSSLTNRQRHNRTLHDLGGIPEPARANEGVTPEDDGCGEDRRVHTGLGWRVQQPARI
jgi:hypothetical protein